MQRKCLKYRLYPTKAQEGRLEQTLETCRQVYNSLLNWHKHDYDVFGKTVSRYQMNGVFPQWRKDFPEIAEVHSQVLQNISLRVELAFSAFFRRVKTGEAPGFPRFKKDSYDSFCYPGAGSGYEVINGGLRLSKITDKNSTIKMRLHRPLVGKIKTCCIHRVGSKWFVCFSVEQEDNFLPPSSDSIGLDAGLNAFMALSNGEFINNPRFFRYEEKALAKAQRKLEKQKRSSSARKNVKKVVSRIHERTRNRRHNFLHQTARKLVNRFGVIAVEKLNVKNMSKTPNAKPDQNNEGQFLPNGASAKAGLNKSILDASWSQFRIILTSKAESAGREVIEVNPAYTSQDCHACGYRARKTLKERWHHCPMCGASLDRDTNAAINILNAALNLSGTTLSQVTPVEAPVFTHGE
jgi:putative transposase